MKNLPLSLAALFLFAVSASSQAVETWGCDVKDYKCQLDVRMRALNENPKDPENYYNLGIVYQRSGAHKEAVETFTKYVAMPGIKPQYLADGYNNRAVSLRKLQQSDRAYADYTKAIEIDPTHGKALANRAGMNAEMKKFTEALADYTRAIAVEPSYAESYYGRAGIYLARKEYARTIPDYEKYVTLVTRPDYLYDGYLNLGLAHYYTGDHQKALTVLTKAIDLNPTDPKAYRNRALVYKALNKPDLAQADDLKANELEAAR
jgi:tetratricopeptide (TPR) repeat protein